jgi:hypothetical protein
VRRERHHGVAHHRLRQRGRADDRIENGQTVSVEEEPGP